jgi:vesicle-associated membrane protein 72
LRVERESLQKDGVTFCFERTGDYVYCVVADKDYGRTIPFAFLSRISRAFEARYGPGISRAGGISVSGFKSTLREEMNYCMSHPNELDRVENVQNKIADVKGIVVQNIESVLARGERIEDMVDKTEELRAQAMQFRNDGKKVHRSLSWQNLKMKLTVLILLLTVGVVIFLIVCSSLRCW